MRNPSIRTGLSTIPAAGAVTDLQRQKQRADAALGRAQRELESRPQQCLETAGRCLRLAERLRYEGGIARAHLLLGLANWSVGQLDEALRHLEGGLTAARRARDRATAARCINGLGATYDRLGDFATALQYFERFMVMPETERDLRTRLMGVINVGHVLERIGRQEEALARYLAAVPQFEGRAVNGTGLLYLNIGVALVMTQREAEALPWMDRAVDDLQASARSTDLALALCNRAEVRGQLGARESAWRDLQQARTLAEQLDAVQVAWRAEVVRGRLQRREGDPVASVATLERALAFQVRCDEHELLRMTHEELATSHEAAGQFAEALVHHKRFAALQIQVLESAAQLSAQRALLALRARAAPGGGTDLRPLRVRPVRDGSGSRSASHAGSAALSEREREVLQLIGEGLSNKEMAATLGISANTVRFHVSGVFNKLGVSRRSEAVRVAAVHAVR